MSPRVKQWLLLGSLFAFLVVGSIWRVEQWLHDSDTGTVRVGTTTKSDIVTPQPLTVTNDYFSTVLPAGFSTVRQTTGATPAILLQFLAVSAGQPSEQFAITIGTLPSDGLKGLGDYNLRTSQPADYQPYVPPNLPAGAKAFQTVTDPVAFTVFWPHGTTYAEIALSSSSGASLEQLSAVFSQAVTTWSWK
jgi:hypothetical protein